MNSKTTPHSRYYCCHFINAKDSEFLVKYSNRWLNALRLSDCVWLMDFDNRWCFNSTIYDESRIFPKMEGVGNNIAIWRNLLPKLFRKKWNKMKCNIQCVISNWKSLIVNCLVVKSSHACLCICAYYTNSSKLVVSAISSVLSGGK